MEIIETEEYLGFLRAKRSMIETRVAEADEQIGVLREVMDQHQISENLISVDDEASLPPSSSSLESDNYNELPTSDDYAVSNAAESGAASNTRSTGSQHQTVTANPMEDGWVRWGAGEDEDISDKSEGSDRGDKE